MHLKCMTHNSLNKLYRHHLEHSNQSYILNIMLHLCIPYMESHKLYMIYHQDSNQWHIHYMNQLCKHYNLLSKQYI